MAGYTRKITEKMQEQGLLLLEEQVLAAARCGREVDHAQATAAIRMAQSGLEGRLGAAAARAATRGLVNAASDAPRAEWPMSDVMTLVLTNQRLLLWHNSYWLGKPKRLAAAAPVEQVLSLDVVKFKVNRIVNVLLVDGTAVVLRSAPSSDLTALSAAFAQIGRGR